MARYVQDVVLNKPDDFVFFIMNDYLQKNGFTMSDWKGEPAYRAGDPMMEGYKYLKWTYSNGVFHLEAWLRGTLGGEWDLDGFVGCAMKAPYKKNLTQLIEILQQPLPQSGPGTSAAQTDGSPQNPTAQTDNMGQNAQPAGTTQPGGTPAFNAIPVQTVDNHGAATRALVFGILSIVCCWSYLFCIIFAVLAFSQARMGQGSSKAGQAKAGKICAIVALCLTVVLFVLNIALASLSGLGALLS